MEYQMKWILAQRGAVDEERPVGGLVKSTKVDEIFGCAAAETEKMESGVDEGWPKIWCFVRMLTEGRRRKDGERLGEERRRVVERDERMRGREVEREGNVCVF